MPSEYCTESDLYSFGLPRGSLPNAGRVANTASTATSSIALNVHGFVTDDPVRFRADASGGSLPSPLVEGTTYYAQPLDGDRFRVSASPGGAPITLTTAGARIVVATPTLPIPAAIQWASAIIEDQLPAHLVPLPAPYPPIIVMTCAELAAHKLLARTGSSTESLSAMADAAMARVARWAKGVPLRGANVEERRANLAASATAPRLDRRGWGRYGGIG